MTSPYDYTRLYRKEDTSDEADPRTMELEDYYEMHSATMDIAQIVDIAEGYADKNKISTITLASGNILVALIPLRKMRQLIKQARIDAIRDGLFIRNQ